MKVNILTLGKMLITGCMATLLLSCNNNAAPADKEQKEAKDSVVKENKEVSLKPAELLLSGDHP